MFPRGLQSAHARFVATGDGKNDVRNEMSNKTAVLKFRHCLQSVLVERRLGRVEHAKGRRTISSPPVQDCEETEPEGYKAVRQRTAEFGPQGTQCLLKATREVRWRIYRPSRSESRSC